MPELSRPVFRITFSDRIADIIDGKPVLRCPWQWWQQVIENKHSQPTEFSSAGEAGHKVAELYGRHCVSSEVDKDMEYFEHLVNRLTSGADLFGLKFDSDDAWYQTVWNFAAIARFNPAHEHYFESKFAFSRENYERLQLIEGPGRYNVKQLADYAAGQVDHFAMKNESEGTLTDYKMGYRNITDWQEAENSLQMLMYAWACFLLWPELQKVTANLWGPMWGRNNRSTAVFMRDETIAKCEAWLNWQFLFLDELWEKHGKDWPANESDACRYCSLLCPIYLATEEQYPDITEKVKVA